MSEPKRKTYVLPYDLWIRVRDYRFSEKLETETEAVVKLLQQGLDTKQEMVEESKAK